MNNAEDASSIGVEQVSDEAVNKQIRVFISKKETDEIIAKRIRSKLQVYGGDRLNIITSQDIPQGAEWIAWIKDTLTSSDVLLLLFTDPHTSWDWCLYEVGMYTPLSDRRENPIICLHTPFSEPPSPLKHLQAVKGELNSMKDFLRKFFGTDEITGINPPINSKFAESDQELTATAEYICETLAPTSTLNSERIYYTRHIDILVEPERLTKEEIPRDAVVKADPLSLEIFGLLDRPPKGNDWDWGAIVDAMHESGQKSWIPELVAKVFQACRNQFIKPTDELLVSLTSRKKYRAVIHRRDAIGDDLVSIRLLFIHQPSESDSEKTVPTTIEGKVPRSIN